ncbi:MAG: hypothetical protein Q9227_003560 [Pyrenula ochraceoflavens]
MATKPNYSRPQQPQLSLRTTRAKEDSHVDSISASDTSNIPKPSPTTSKVTTTARPRRAIGNTKTLKAAWDHNASVHVRNSDSYPAQQLPKKPPPAQAVRRSTLPSQQIPRRATPSPTRPATGDSVTSPDYSSPPKGLEDVYQRIADEENLAAQEGAISDEDASDGQRYPRDQARINRLRKSSPLSFRSSRRNSPRPRSFADRVQEVEDKENYVEGQTDGTRASGLSFLDNMTDQALAAKLTPHTIDRARDRARLERALHKDSPVFGNARSRGLLTEENLQERGSVEHNEAANGSSAGSVSSGRLDAPLNVPKTWGSRAKPQKDWLKRIYSPKGSIQDGQNTSQIDWTAAAADVPLPSVEEGTPSRPPSSDHSIPPSIKPQSSLDRIRQWEMNDFTEKSLPVSQSPPVRQRNALLDDIRDREIESLEKQAVATSRIGELREKESREHIRKSRSPSTGANRPVIEDVRKAEAMAAQLDTGDEGVPKSSTPIPHLEKNEVSCASRRGSIHGDQRPIQKKSESRESLRRLSQALNNNSRPSSLLEEWSLVAKKNNLNAVNGEALLGSDTTGPDTNHKGSVPYPTADKIMKTPAAPGAWTDTILPDTVRTLKSKNVVPKYLKTPHVTGAWIDTPLPAGKRPSSLPVQDSIMEEEAATDTLQDSKIQEAAKARSHSDSEAIESMPAPNRGLELPRSALGDLIDKARRNRIDSPERHDTLNIGDGTLDSLEDLLTLDATDMTTLMRVSAHLEAKQPDGANALGDEGELLERLGTKLDRLRNNIHDARKGISKLEHQVVQSEGQGDNRSRGPCQSCGCPRGWIPVDTPRKVYLALPIPRVLSDRKQGQWVPRPTMLGYSLFLFTSWFLAEKLACAYYCKPLYAAFYHRPVEPEPFPGRALPTMLWRWFIRPWFWPLWTLLWPLIKALGIGLGFWDGFVDMPLGAGVMSEKGYSWEQHVGASPVQGPDLSMMNDELL